MNTSRIREVIERNKGAARRALDQTFRAMGHSTDPDVRLYNRLTPQDFEQIAAQQGEDGLLEYITEMERRRLESR